MSHSLTSLSFDRGERGGKRGARTAEEQEDKFPFVFALPPSSPSVSFPLLGFPFCSEINYGGEQWSGSGGGDGALRTRTSQWSTNRPNRGTTASRFRPRPRRCVQQLFRLPCRSQRGDELRRTANFPSTTMHGSRKHGNRGTMARRGRGTAECKKAAVTARMCTRAATVTMRRKRETTRERREGGLSFLRRRRARR